MTQSVIYSVLTLVLAASILLSMTLWPALTKKKSVPVPTERSILPVNPPPPEQLKVESPTADLPKTVWTRDVSPDEWIIFSTVVNNPTFIEIQYRTLQRFFHGPFTMVVFNDAKNFKDLSNGGDLTLRRKIREMCDRLGVVCFDLENSHHEHMGDMAVRHTESMRHVVKFMQEHKCHHLILDSDMFLVDHFYPGKEFQAPDAEGGMIKYNVAGLFNSRTVNGQVVEYLWPGICYFNTPTLPDFELLSFDCTPGTDAGGKSHVWLDMQKSKSTPIYHLPQNTSGRWVEADIPPNLSYLKDFLLNDYRNALQDGGNIKDRIFCELFDHKFLHYRAGSNWNCEGMDLHNALTVKLRQAVLGSS